MNHLEPHLIGSQPLWVAAIAAEVPHRDASAERLGAAWQTPLPARTPGMTPHAHGSEVLEVPPPEPGWTM